MYKRIIGVYENNKLEVSNGKIMINGKAVNEYTFKQNYYWAMGTTDTILKTVVCGVLFLKIISWANLCLSGSQPKKGLCLRASTGIEFLNQHR